ncbi:uncharacterized protein [Antedon mediterranea]|uniref:uncharacterized protein n=1 Tax=Antedon mediterranea TaxID=105859 RepID=UPI003AF6FDB0
MANSLQVLTSANGTSNSKSENTSVQTPTTNIPRSTLLRLINQTCNYNISESNTTLDTLCNNLLNSNISINSEIYREDAILTTYTAMSLPTDSTSESGHLQDSIIIATVNAGKTDIIKYETSSNIATGTVSWLDWKREVLGGKSIRSRDTDNLLTYFTKYVTENQGKPAESEINVLQTEIVTVISYNDNYTTIPENTKTFIETNKPNTSPHDLNEEENNNESIYTLTYNIQYESEKYVTETPGYVTVTYSSKTTLENLGIPQTTRSNSDHLNPTPSEGAQHTSNIVIDVFTEPRLNVDTDEYVEDKQVSAVYTPSNIHVLTPIQDDISDIYHHPETVPAFENDIFTDKAIVDITEFDIITEIATEYFTDEDVTNAAISFPTTEHKFEPRLKDITDHMLTDIPTKNEMENTKKYTNIMIDDEYDGPYFETSRPQLSRSIENLGTDQMNIVTTMSVFTETLNDYSSITKNELYVTETVTEMFTEILNTTENNIQYIIPNDSEKDIIDMSVGNMNVPIDVPITTTIEMDTTLDILYETFTNVNTFIGEDFQPVLSSVIPQSSIPPVEISTRETNSSLPEIFRPTDDVLVFVKDKQKQYDIPITETITDVHTEVITERKSADNDGLDIEGIAPTTERDYVTSSVPSTTVIDVITYGTKEKLTNKFTEVVKDIVTYIVTDTVSNTDTDIATDTVTNTVNDMVNDIVTVTNTEEDIDTDTNTVSNTVTETVTDTVTDATTNTNTDTITDTVFNTISHIFTDIVTDTFTNTGNDTTTEMMVTDSVTEIVTDTVTYIVTDTVSNTDTDIATDTVTNTVTDMVNDIVTVTYTEADIDTDTNTVSNTVTEIITDTVTDATTNTNTDTITDTVSNTISYIFTDTVTNTFTDTGDYIATDIMVTDSVTDIVTDTVTYIVTDTFGNTDTNIVTDTVTNTVTNTVNDMVNDIVTVTNTEEDIDTDTNTVSNKVTETVTDTNTDTITDTVSNTISHIFTDIVTDTFTDTGNDKDTDIMVTDSVTDIVTDTVTYIVTDTVSNTDTDIATNTVTNTVTDMVNDIVTVTYTEADIDTDTNTVSNTFTEIITDTVTDATTNTNTDTITHIFTDTVTDTMTHIFTDTVTDTFTYTGSDTATGIMVADSVTEITDTVTNTGTDKVTDTNTVIDTVTDSVTDTVTDMVNDTVSNTVTEIITDTVTDATTNTNTDTITDTVSNTISHIFTDTVTETFTDTGDDIATDIMVTDSVTDIVTDTVTYIVTDTFGNTDTNIVTDTVTNTVTNNTVNHMVNDIVTVTNTEEDIDTDTNTVSNKVTETITDTVADATTNTNTDTITDTVSNTISHIFTDIVTDTFTDTGNDKDTDIMVTDSVTEIVTDTVTYIVTDTVSNTDTDIATDTVTNTVTDMVNDIVTVTYTEADIDTDTNTVSNTFTEIITDTVTDATTNTNTDTISHIFTDTVTDTMTYIFTDTVTDTFTYTDSDKATGIMVADLVTEITDTVTNTGTDKVTDTNTVIDTVTDSVTDRIIKVTVNNEVTVTNTEADIDTYTNTVTNSVTDTVTETITDTITDTVTDTTTNTNTINTITYYDIPNVDTTIEQIGTMTSDAVTSSNSADENYESVTETKKEIPVKEDTLVTTRQKYLFTTEVDIITDETEFATEGLTNEPVTYFDSHKEMVDTYTDIHTDINSRASSPNIDITEAGTTIMDAIKIVTNTDINLNTEDDDQIPSFNEKTTTEMFAISEESTESFHSSVTIPSTVSDIEIRTKLAPMHTDDSDENNTSLVGMHSTPAPSLTTKYEYINDGIYTISAHKAQSTAELVTSLRPTDNNVKTEHITTMTNVVKETTMNVRCAPNQVNLSEIAASTNNVTASWTSDGCADYFEITCSSLGIPSTSRVMLSEDQMVTCADVDSGSIIEINVTSVSGIKHGETSSILITTVPAEVSLKMSSSTINSITASWAPAPGRVEYYSVVCVDEGEVLLTNDGAAVIFADGDNENHLRASCINLSVPGKSYLLGVYSHSNGLRSSMAIIAISTERLSFQLVEGGSTTSTVSASWERFGSNMVDLYKISCSQGIASPSEVGKLALPKASCVDLPTPGSVYSMTVTVINGGLPIETSLPFLLTTLPFGVELRKVSSTTSSITCEWDLPAGEVDYFEVRCSDGVVENPKISVDDSSSLRASCRDLPMKENIYTIYVISVSNSKRSAPASSITIKTAMATNDSATTIIALVVGAVCFLLILILICVVIYECKKRPKKKKSVPAARYTKTPATNPLYIAESETIVLTEVHEYLKYDDQLSAFQQDEYEVITDDVYEFTFEKLQFLEELGKGAFGKVYKAHANNIAGKMGVTVVAVKALQEGASEVDKQDFRNELSLMKKMPPHPNVIRLLGACTRIGGEVIILEYANYGSLLSYLRTSRVLMEEGDYCNIKKNTSILSTSDLIRMALQVVKGMIYISSLNIIHRDLAARNILVDENHVCKISDFGLSRQTCEFTDTYVKSEKRARLPIRWMAYESLFEGLYTSKSDVWSFGVLLWEIATRGENPYAGKKANDLLNFLQKGYRMKRPQTCSRELYDVMLKCWEQRLERRPTFLTIFRLLDRLLTDSDSDYITFDGSDHLV